MPIKDRIKELRRIPASELLPNPKNWRTHPNSQLNVGRLLTAETTRQTQSGAMLGTFMYMAPEQLADAKRASSRPEVEQRLVKQRYGSRRDRFWLLSSSVENCSENRINPFRLPDNLVQDVIQRVAIERRNVEVRLGLKSMPNQLNDVGMVE